MLRSCTLMPLGSVTWIVSVVWVFTFPGTGDGVMMMVGFGTGITVTDVETFDELPKTSVTVPVITKVPAVLKTWLTLAGAEIAPRSCAAVPSPQSTLTFRTESPGGADAANVKVAGRFALGSVLGGVIARVSAGAVTVTEVDVVTWLPALSVTLPTTR